MTFTEEQVAALAPDASSLKSGKDLGIAGKWQLTGISTRALWGNCQGSGKLPYQAQIDLHNLAFKCTCPSRKFPCKHGLGLLFLYARQPASFTNQPEPDWVDDWLKKRTEKVEKKNDQKDKPVDAEAQAKRAEARNKKINDGIEDLQFWIKDLIRNGLLNIPENAYDFWKAPVKRMIDFQAPGLAGLVKNLGTINYYKETWKYQLLYQLLKIYTLSESYKHIEELPPDIVFEVKTLIGFNQTKEEVFAQKGTHDKWIVLCRSYTEEDQLTIERNWLYGTNTGKYAFILQFITTNQVPEINLMPGTTVDAELVFYKGAIPYRALIKQQNNVNSNIPANGLPSFNAVFENFSTVISSNPFYDKVPAIINDVRFIKHNEWYLADNSGFVMPVNSSDNMAFKILAITGGNSFTISALVNETEVEPLAIWANNKFYSIASNGVQK
jgi:hypothetical protein